jgi:succinoglycan biosynthesis transport protein ExoP
VSQLPPGGPDGLFEDESRSGAQPNPLLIAHRALRGRYLLAGVLGLLLAAPCAIVGYVAIPPEYTSRAVLEVNVTLPGVLYGGDDLGDVIPAVQAFVSQQASSIQSERVLIKAIDDSRLRGENWPIGPQGLIRLRDNLTVATPRGANLIIVEVTDRSPSAARAAAQATLDSYNAIRDEQERLLFGDKISQLEALQQKYQRERNEKANKALDRAVTVAGTEDLQQAQQLELKKLADIEDQIREFATLLSLAGSLDETPVGSEQAEQEQAEADAETIDSALVADDFPDIRLERLVDERDLLQRQLDSLLLVATPQHRQAKQYARQLRVLELEIEMRRAEITASMANAESGEVSLPTGTSRAELEARLEDLQRNRDEARTQLERIARTRLEVVAYQQEAEQANSRLEDAERRLEALRVEQGNRITGRVQVAQQPEQPLAPSTDRRRPLAGAGFVGGFGLGVFGVAAFGFAFPRVRVADDIGATRGEFSMIGMIPEFPEHASNGQGMNIREAFQFLRVLLDARAGRGTLICGVTSPTAGDGKTTVSIRLAQSFASAHRRVLLIDADLVGRGATRSLGVSPREIEKLEFRTLDQSIVRLEDSGIDFIPASRGEDASEIFCGRVLGEMIDEMRSQYDVVLVDTGPILGSIEAAAMTPMMDQILLVVARGLESRLLRMATDRLRELNARSVGLVFNRATTIDFNRSFAPPSSTSRRSTARGLPDAKIKDVRESMDEGSPRGT